MQKAYIKRFSTAEVPNVAKSWHRLQETCTRVAKKGDVLFLFFNKLAKERNINLSECNLSKFFARFLFRTVNSTQAATTRNVGSLTLLPRVPKLDYSQWPAQVYKTCFPLTNCLKLHLQTLSSRGHSDHEHSSQRATATYWVYSTVDVNRRQVGEMDCSFWVRRRNGMFFLVNCVFFCYFEIIYVHSVYKNDHFTKWGWIENIFWNMVKY